GPSATPSSTPSFTSPLGNQVPVHTDVPGQAHTHIDPSQATAEIQVALVASELIVGSNRFAVGLLDGKGQAIKEASVHFHYFDLKDASNPTLESETDATRLVSPDGLTAIFAHEREFSHAGDWGVEVQARFADGHAAVKRIGFKVVATSPTIKPGQKAPAVDTPTLASVKDDLSKLSSSQAPNAAFYRFSLKQALANGKPTVLLLATPAFCQTRFCGPAYDITSDVQKRFGDRVNFIHVEVYTGLPNPAANNFELAPIMKSFGLSTEPWLYLIKPDGTVDFRLEGFITRSEIERHLQPLLGA
ncbi:MAG: hypothetical protein LC737_08185, partial [Chloroflexi bacterium]|nr:hypothetical protein [Chloroflexota bacterium]